MEARCIDVRPVQDRERLAASTLMTGLGADELRAIALAELSADLVLIDERKARRYAQSKLVRYWLRWHFGRSV